MKVAERIRSHRLVALHKGKLGLGGSGDVELFSLIAALGLEGNPGNVVLLSHGMSNAADRDGDNHYDLLSALQKSIRGSDPDAACHYLARLLEVGQMQSACRRLMVIAAEDIGLAYPMILPIVKSCVDMALMLGMPEARIPLGDAAVLMATSPKSNTGHIALDTALADIRKGKTGDFPRHLQNMHADSYTMEREQGYLYPHDYPNHWVKQQYLPDELKNTRYYTYGSNKVEQAAKQYWDAVKGEG